MKKIAVFYGSTGGTTKGVVDEIDFDLRDADIYDVKDGIDSMNEYENLILAVPTYGVGELQEDWLNIFEQFKSMDFSGKVVALVGVGNQKTFGESFVGALKLLYDVLIEKGAELIGFTSTEGYHFEECEAIIGDKFMGLVIDEANQDDETPDRIYDWLEEIKPFFK